MNATEQLVFPFASLDFPGRTVLYLHEIAEKLGCSIDQVYDLVEDNTLTAVNIASAGAKRRELRVPIEAWRNFILARMSGPLRRDFMLSLPKATLRELRREIDQLLTA